MSKVKVALIGAGGMANAVHYPSVTSFSDVEVVGLCDVDRQRLEETAKKFGIGSTFSDHKEMLAKTSPDAVYALMPPHVLFEVAMDVLERGHALFVEKPPALTTFQAENLARMAERKGVVTAVGFQRRYHPMVHRVWDEVRKKGEIHQVTASFFKNLPPQETHPYYRGSIDIMHCDAIHALDAIRYYCGLAEVRSVHSDVRTLDCWYQVSFNALIRFANDAVGILQTNWRTGRRFFKFEFHGFGSMAFADIDGEGTVWADNKNDPVLTTDVNAAAGDSAMHVAQGFRAESRAFIDAVKSKAQLHNSMSDAVKSMRLADMILSGGCC
jgi:predicted dehydrogenase